MPDSTPSGPHDGQSKIQNPKSTIQSLPDSAQAGISLTDTSRLARRMQQLATEVRLALARNNLDIVVRASALLAPTLAQWRAALPTGQIIDAEEARIAREAKQLLDECAQEITQRMGGITRELHRLRRSKDLMSRLRARRPALPPRRIDARW